MTDEKIEPLKKASRQLVVAGGRDFKVALTRSQFEVLLELFMDEPEKDRLAILTTKESVLVARPGRKKRIRVDKIEKIQSPKYFIHLETERVWGETRTELTFRVEGVIPKTPDEIKRERLDRERMKSHDAKTRTRLEEKERRELKRLKKLYPENSE